MRTLRSHLPLKRRPSSRFKNLARYNHKVNSVNIYSACFRFSETRFTRKVEWPDGWSSAVRKQSGRKLREYNVPMARGWESKSVEAQQEEASEKSSRSGKPKMSAEEASAFREKETLRLARQRVLQQLAASSSPRHRKVLQDALAALDEKLGRL